MNKNIKMIKDRQAIIENARLTLKKEYVCLDNVIDRIIDSISLWYIDSSLLERAPIVNLWGPTGTGKTSIVKRLVNLLGLDDVYRHISMISLDKSLNNNEYTNFQELLFTETDVNNSNNVIMLDEFQWFNSKNRDGAPERQLFTDIWDFFSEREIKRDILLKNIYETKRKLDNYAEFNCFISDYAVFSRKNNNKVDKTPGGDFGEHGKIDKKNLVGDICTIHDLSVIRKIYFPDMSRKELARTNAITFLKLLSDKLASKDLFKDFSCKNYLIIISGNLDSAYPFCDDVSDYDFDADYYHNLSSKVDIKSIKKSLKDLFRDEHVSRLGNLHVMFPTLSKNGYRMIIDRYSNSLLESVANKHGVNVSLSENIKDMIYRNSIFPTQGARPVFTSVNDFVNSNISKYILEAIIKGIKNITIDYDEKEFSSYSNELNKSIFYMGDIDRIRQDASKKVNAKVLAAVHEAGHAIVFSLLYGIVPNKIVVATSDEYYGMTFLDFGMFSLKQYESDIMVCYGGVEAEKIVFGIENSGVVAIADMERATEKLAILSRKSGLFSNTNSTPITSQSAHNYNTNIDSSNNIMEELSAKYRERVRSLLSSNIKMLVDLSDIVFNKGHLEGYEIKEFFKSYGFDFISKSYSGIESDCCCVGDKNFIDIFNDVKEKLLKKEATDLH